MQSLGAATKLNNNPYGYLPESTHTKAIIWSPPPTLSAIPIEKVKSRRAPLVVRVNRSLRTVLVGLCGIAILCYGLDVATSNDVGKLQDQARRLNEQNTELSAQLLRVISFQGIQDSMLGHSQLRVPEQVLIVKEVQPYPLTPFEPGKYYLPLLAGY